MRAFSILILLGLGLTLVACSGSTSFTRGSLGDALDDQVADAGGDVSGDIIDKDGDGSGDCIDFDADGTCDVAIDPVPLPPGTDPNDPGAPVRNPDTGSCIVAGRTKAFGLTSSTTINEADLDGAESIYIKLSSSGKTVTINLPGMTTLQRITVNHSGSTNTINVQNSAMHRGFCNEGLTGGDNVENLKSTSSAPIVDVMTGGGNDHKFEVDFIPDEYLKYNLGTNGVCISYLAGTTVDPASTGGAIVLDDGSPCP